MSDLVLWVTGAIILVVFAAVVWLNRRRMKAEVARMQGGHPEFEALAKELRRSNDLLEKTLGDHESRLRTLERDKEAGKAREAGRSGSP